MAEIWLDCSHPAVVTHERGERLIYCAVPGCSGANTVAAHAVTSVVYEVLQVPAALRSEMQQSVHTDVDATA